MLGAELPFPKETQAEMETIENNVQSIRGDSQEQESAKLKLMGDFLVTQNLWQCNIFGGEEACSALGRGSGHEEQCPNQNNRVDCAFKGGAEEEFEANFYLAIGRLFNLTGESCPVSS